MKTYRAPGVYSKFIPSTEAVTGSSPIRKMAIVGTGQRFFNVSNQPIKRGNDKIYDEFDQDNVLEISGIYSCPLVNGKLAYSNGIAYTGYRLGKNGKIEWLPIATDGSALNDYLTPARFEKSVNSQSIGSEILMRESVTSVAFKTKEDGELDFTDIKDGDYILEVTSTDLAGAFTIYNETAGELIGEYLISETLDYRDDIIPGMRVKICGTMISEISGEYLFDKNIAVGDSIRISVSAPRTYLEATANLNFAPKNRDLNNLDIVVIAHSKKYENGTPVREGDLGAKKVLSNSQTPINDKTEIQYKNVKPNKGETINIGDVVREIKIVQPLVLEGEDEQNLMPRYVLANGEATTELTTQLNINLPEITLADNAGYDINGKFICKYSTANLDAYNSAHGTEYALEDIQFDINGDYVEERNELSLKLRVLVNGDATDPNTGIVSDQLNFIITKYDSNDDGTYEFQEIKLTDRNRKELTEIPTGLKFVLTGSRVSNVFDQAAECVYDGTVGKQLADFKVDLLKLINITSEDLEDNSDAVEKQKKLAAVYKLNSLINPLNALGICMVRGLETYITDVTIKKEAIMKNADYLVRYVSGKTTANLKIKVDKVVPKLNKNGKIMQTLTTIAGPISAVDYADGLMNTLIPGVGFKLDVDGLINAIRAGRVYSGSILGIVSSRPKAYSLNQPKPNTTYYVNYKYAKTDFEPTLFTDYDDIVAEYGNYSVALNGQVTNGVTLAAKIALNNGASEIIIAQVENNTVQGYKDAIDKLSDVNVEISNVDLIVPLSTDYEVQKYVSDHVTKYSDNIYNMYRMAYVGASKNEPIDSDDYTYEGTELGSVQRAMGLNNERVVYVVPGSINMSVLNSITGYYSIRNLPASYAAVAVAALSMRNDVAEPLTNKELYGFSSVGTFYKELEANKLAAAGCLVLKQDGTSVKVRHGITTHYEFETFNDIHSNEITLVQIKDRIINICRQELGSKYVGGKLRTTASQDVEYTLTQILNTLASSEIIIGYDNLSVKRDTSNPMQINIRFFVEAVYPLNFIEIAFGFSTQISQI